MIKIKVHTKNYRKDKNIKDILKNVNLDLKKGDFYSLLGASGIGKTTLLNIIAGLDINYNGSVKIQDNSSQSSRVSMIFQEPRLLPWQTVEENLKFVLPDSLDKLETTKKINEILELVGLLEVKKSWVKSLSGGMAQRVSIARALIVNPTLLLLDEPFSSLDYFTKRDLIKQLKTIVEEKKLTCIMVTHDFNEAISLSNRIGILGNVPATIVEEKKVEFENRDNWASTKFNNYRQWLEKSFL